MNSPDSISIILPAKNEAINLVDLLPQLKSLYPLAEILVINDGATDNTAQVAINQWGNQWGQSRLILPDSTKPHAQPEHIRT